MANTDLLKNLPPARVAAWYRRLADAWTKSTPELKPPLAGLFLKTWLDNRDPTATIAFDAPEHVKQSSAVYEVQLFHSKVFVSKERGSFGKGARKWAGILPRVQGKAGYATWDMKSPLQMEYESLCDIAPNLWAIGKIQQFGTNSDRDILGSLRGFQLKSQVVVSAQPIPNSSLATVQFRSWHCSGRDRYDWNYSEYLTVFNPDFHSTAADAVRPTDKQMVVYHSNAKRLEDARLAAPYDVALRPWQVTDTRVTGARIVDLKQQLF